MKKDKIRNLVPEFTESQWAVIVRLLAFVIFLVIGIVVALILIKTGKEYAFEISAKYDLVHFIEIDQAYYADNGTHCAEVGDIISGVPEIKSTLTLEDFISSSGVVMEIISENPFVVISRHVNTKKTFEYNSRYGIISEREAGERNGEEAISEKLEELPDKERDTAPNGTD